MDLKAPHTSQINNDEIYRYNNERRELLTTLYEGEDLPTIRLAYYQLGNVLSRFSLSWKL